MWDYAQPPYGTSMPGAGAVHPIIHVFAPLRIGKKGVNHRTESGDDEER
jgi:hypothetical protein